MWPCLKYIADHPLSKFFGGNAQPAKKQQSTLAFSSTASDRLKTENEKHPATNGHVDQEHEELKMEHSDDDSKSTVKAEPSSAETRMEDGDDASSSPRKRVAEDEPSDDDDEPPTKKARTKLTQRHAAKTTSDADGKAKKPGRKSMNLKDEPVEEDEEPKSSKIDRKQTPKKRASKVVEEGEDETETSTKPAAGSNGVLDAEHSPEVDEAEEEDSEDEKPDQAAKKREMVQQTLSQDTKDPYPDWKVGAPVPYAALCTTFSKIEMTTKRLEIMAHCSLFLRQVMRLTPTDLLPTVQLMVNKIAADYSGIELGIGESLIMKAIGETTGKSLKFIKEDQSKIGDLGLVAAKSRQNQGTLFKPQPLTVRGVHEGLMRIATVEGQGSQQRKVDGIKKLLSSADTNLPKGAKSIDITKDQGGPSESKFIIRALEGKMRLGLAEKTIIVALAQAVATHEASQKGTVPSTEQLAKAEATLKSVFNELPSYEVVVPAMVEHGIHNLHDACKLQPGVPLKPMLARPTKSIGEVLNRFENKEFTCEYKYDGERAQIHFVAHDSDQQYVTPVPQAGKNDKGISNIFSRNSEDLSKKYPDILQKLPSWIQPGTQSFVLDCETVAWDTEAKKVLPFQQLMTRKRKDVKVEDVKVQVCVFAFDLLFLNGVGLVNQPFRARRAALYSAFTPIEGEFAFAQHGNVAEVDAIQTLLEASVRASCEGLMVKMLDGPESHYEPSRRSQNWLKVKKDYLAGVGDSLDLVVLGAYYGRGKRTAVFGAFLLACYNAARDEYESVCNIGTGFSEAALEALHEQLAAITIARPKPFYRHAEGTKDQPDVWLEPRYVWEVKTADLTLSPRYKAAADQMDGGKGVSLRFPRFLRVRDDKKPEEATTSRSVADMYRAQAGSAAGGVDDDFEY